MDSIASVFTKSNLIYMMQGLLLTVEIAISTIILSLIFGTLLALVKTYSKGKFKFLSYLTSAYIELFRCTPNLLWIYFIYFGLKGSQYVIGTLIFTVFTSAVVAEIVRGGLNAIPKGQFEGAASQGFNFFQTLAYIVLPQTFKSIIPALLSQMTTVIKDTCYLRAVAIADFMWQGMVVIGQYAVSFTQIVAVFAFMAAVYFIINFTLSVLVRKYQKRIMIQ